MATWSIQTDESVQQGCAQSHSAASSANKYSTAIDTDRAINPPNASAMPPPLTPRLPKAKLPPIANQRAATVTRAIANLIRKYPAVLRLPFHLFHRMQNRYTIGVAAVLLDHQNRVLIVEHAFHPRYPWGLPGGWIGPDEHPADAILRELREELSLSASVLSLLHAAKPYPSHIDLSFLCQPHSPIGPLNHELLDCRWAAPNDLPPLRDFHRKSIDIARAKHNRDT